MIFKGTCSKCGRIIKLEVKIPKITDDSYDDYERYERARDERYISAGNVANEINWKYTEREPRLPRMQYDFGIKLMHVSMRASAELIPSTRFRYLIIRDSVGLIHPGQLISEISVKYRIMSLTISTPFSALLILIPYSSSSL